MLELPLAEYQKLEEAAARLGKPPQLLVQEWVTEQLTKLNPVALTDREKARQALRAAGLLAELHPDLQKLADPSVSLEEVREALGRDKTITLSDLVIQLREPKE